MAGKPDPERVREAVRILEEEFGQPDHLELYYYDYDGRDHINFHCPTPPAGVEESTDDRYRLEQVELGGNTAWTISSVDVPTELKY